MAGDGRQKTDDGRQMTDDGLQKTDARRQMTEDRGQMAGDRVLNSEFGMRKEKRGQSFECGMRKKANIE